MQIKLIAKVRPLKEGNTYGIGTGYPVASNLLLTARHVVFPHWDNTGKVEIEWLSDQFSHKATVESIVFDGHDEVDLVVLRFIPALTQIHACRLGRDAPNLNQRWDSFGYARLGKYEDDGGRELISALGEFHHPNPSNPYINLNAKSDAIEKANWAGISGAPVFQENILYAVISSTPSNRQECFRAVYLPFVLSKYPAFCQCVLGSDSQRWSAFIEAQEDQIEHLVNESFDGVFLKFARQQLPCFNGLKEAKAFTKTLLDVFNQDALALLDALLQLSEELLKTKSDRSIILDIRHLFCLLVSLLASHYVAARQAYIRLAVYTRMAAELHTAPLYGTNPDFIFDEDSGELRGKCALDAHAVFVKESGWQTEALQKEAFSALYTEIYKGSSKKLPKDINTFERKKLNTVLKQRQNRISNQLYRFELNASDPEFFEKNPLSDPILCQALTAFDWLPDLPIVHYGEQEAPSEAELSAKMDELFLILQKYGAL